MSEHVQAVPSYVKVSGKKSINETGHYQYGVRASMARLPSGLQSILSYITGKPLPHEAPLFKFHPTVHSVVAIAAFLGLIASAIVIFMQSHVTAFVLAVPYWIVMTGFYRRLQVIYAHHAAHDALSSKKWVNRLFADVLTTLGFIQNGDEYKATHVSHHSRRDFTTERDIGAQFLLKFGFFPGTDKEKLWAHFWATVFSARFHWLFLIARLKSNFVTARPFRLLLSIVWGLALGAACYYTPFWVFATAVLVPMIPLYQISTLLNTITEHAWLQSEEGPTDMRLYADRCWARFCGEACPDPAALGVEKIYGWLRWYIRMMVLHLPARLAVFVGDTPAHDWHHLAAYDKHRFDWPYAIFHREAAIASGKAMDYEKREVWGLWNAIDHSFDLLSRKGK